VNTISFEGRFLSTVVSAFSEYIHFIRFNYGSKETEIHLGKGMLIVSIDVDVGNKEVGVINKGKNDANVNRYISEYLVGEIEERALPLIIDFFNDLEIPVTFAIRGQLFEVDASILELLLKSPVKHDIGAHGYYHRDFTNLSNIEADKELNMISVAMKKFGITSRSFIFPKNGVAHLDLLEKYGYKCYRGYGNFMNDSMYINKCGKLYDIHPSLFIGQSISPMFPKKIINISIKRKLPFHVWFHPWDLGETKESIQKSINKVFSPLFKYAKKKERRGVLTFETMLSAAQKVEKICQTQ